MSIKKQEFYEGAALHQIACSGETCSIRHHPPFFQINDRILVLLKYSTRNRSPWGFTFSASEQTLLEQSSDNDPVILGLICGADGVAALDYKSYREIAGKESFSLHIACHRRHGEHYKVSGPEGVLAQKIAPSKWRRVHLLESVDL